MDENTKLAYLFYLTTPTNNLPPIHRSAYVRSAEWERWRDKWADRKWQPQLSHKITTPKLSMESCKPKALSLSLSLPPSLSHSLSLSPVVPACRSLQSVLPPGYFESPNGQPSSLCWGSARPPTRVFRFLWPHEKLRAMSLSFRKLQKKTKICCTYCPRLTRTAFTFTVPVGSIFSEQTFRTLQCLGPYRCIRHSTAVAIFYMPGLQK